MHFYIIFEFHWLNYRTEAKKTNCTEEALRKSQKHTILNEQYDELKPKTNLGKKLFRKLTVILCNNFMVCDFSFVWLCSCA